MISGIGFYRTNAVPITNIVKTLKQFKALPQTQKVTCWPYLSLLAIGVVTEVANPDSLGRLTPFSVKRAVVHPKRRF